MNRLWNLYERVARGYEEISCAMMADWMKPEGERKYTEKDARKLLTDAAELKRRTDAHFSELKSSHADCCSDLERLSGLYAMLRNVIFAQRGLLGVFAIDLSYH